MTRPRGAVQAILAFALVFALGLVITGNARRSQQNTELLKEVRAGQAVTTETLTTLRNAIAAGPKATGAILVQLEADLAQQARAIVQTVRLRSEGVPATIVITRTATRVIVRCELPNGRPCP